MTLAPRWPAALLVVLALSGCRFWYKPIPVANAIGEERTLLGADSVNVYHDDRFEVYGPDPEAVYDGYEQLNRAYRAFERHFAAVPPKLAFVLESDTTAPLDAKPFRDRGFTLVRYVRPRSYKSPTRYGALGYGGVIWPIAPTAARIMLAHFARDLDSASVRARSESAALEELPVWVRAAVIHLLGEAGTASADLEYVREKRESLLPLRDLLTLVRPASGDSLLDPTRRSEADDLTRLIAAQSAALGQFLIEREGPTVLGQIARAYLGDASLTTVLAGLEHSPHTVADLDHRFKVWIDTREEN